MRLTKAYTLRFVPCIGTTTKASSSRRRTKASTNSSIDNASLVRAKSTTKIGSLIWIGIYGKEGDTHTHSHCIAHSPFAEGGPTVGGTPKTTNRNTSGEAEKMAYFMKLDDLDFLEQTRAEYSFIDDDANNLVGYITDDEDDQILEHCDYSSAYNECSAQYRALILSDHCLGRPVYEWQVPYGLDEAHGYKNCRKLCRHRMESSKL